MIRKPVLNFENCLASTPALPVDRARVDADHHLSSSELLLRDEYGGVSRVIFNNHDVFAACVGKHYAINMPCEICGRIYAGRELLGLPVYDTEVKEINGERVIVVYGDGVFCSFEHAYKAYLFLQANQLSVKEQNPVYHNTLSILNMLFELCYPGQLPLADALQTQPVSKYRAFTASTLPNLLFLPIKLGYKEQVKETIK